MYSRSGGAPPTRVHALGPPRGLGERWLPRARQWRRGAVARLSHVLCTSGGAPTVVKPGRSGGAHHMTKLCYSPTVPLPRPCQAALTQGPVHDAPPYPVLMVVLWGFSHGGPMEV